MEKKALINGEHVLRRSWSESDGAIKIIPASNTSFSVDLRAEDGDSVTTHPNTITINDTEIHNCKGMATGCLFGEGRILISPDDDGDDWYELSVERLVPFKLCARRIKILSGKLVL